ncbi:MAG: aspartyl/glutamyl-tRNA amidotransferase subunit C [Oscillospiraceae bacterium]|nr:aspartyl/glutamyl-tRNA amidotransferase subunit C [Oscillospiraceae bacterium]
MIDGKTFDRLTVLSKFDFSAEGKERFTDDLNAIVDFVGKVTEFDGVYDDTLENAVSYADLRNDTAISTASVEQLLSNTDFENNCYIIPKVID